MPEPRTYTAVELRSPTSRPRIRAGQTVRIEALRRRVAGESGYAVTSPCCGRATAVPSWSVDRMRSGQDSGWFECGKPWWPRRGNPRGAGCRARYRVQVVEAGGQPTAFDLTWTGQ